MLEKLKLLAQRDEELSRLLTAPAVFADRPRMTKLLKEQKEIAPVVAAYRAYAACERRAADARGILDGAEDADLRTLAQEEFDETRVERVRLLEQIRVLLLPRDPNDDKNVIVEIRGGAGGEEAALFAASLWRMYTMYAERRRWKTEVLNLNETELGGVKEICFMIEGVGVYSRLKFESGVHRVQRVPDTEASGRIHTSTVTVAVLPEAEEVDFEINPADLQTDTFRSSGAGGQHVNKTESAIRITHLPTGLVVECQDERSQYKNRDKAMKILRSRLLERKRAEQEALIASDRKSQVGTGDRSERIRTYNFPQGRVTDHRIGLTLYKIDAILAGDLDEIMDALITADQADRLRAQEET
ncbi:MAG: peptide chain release factor 1 [Oscillospiraceae bacterium]|jgi:peptide chain release factor 1|nr:peptide chain release factor 1 [Oscillospiraceae bacterium]